MMQNLNEVSAGKVVPAQVCLAGATALSTSRAPLMQESQARPQPAPPTDSRFNKDYIMEKLCHVA